MPRSSSARTLGSRSRDHSSDPNPVSTAFKPPKRVPTIETLTPLRGIAALGVVAFHCDEMLRFSGMETLLPRERSGLIAKGYLWVDFFFLLSGFVITYVYGSWFGKGLSPRRLGVYLWARFTRIYPLHLFTLTLHIGFYGVLLLFFADMAQGWSRIFSWEAIPAHLLLAHAFGIFDSASWNLPSWSIAAEWWTYVVAVGLVPVIGRGSRLRTWTALVVCVGVLYGLTWLHPKGTLQYSHNFGVARCALEFTIGIGLYRGFESRIGWRLIGSDIAFVSVFLSILFGLHLAFSDVLVIPLFCLLILSAAWNRGRVRDVLRLLPLQFLGKISYSIYMMQGIWWLAHWSGMILWMREIGPLPDAGMLRFGLLGSFAVLTVASAIWTHRLIEVRLRDRLRPNLSANAE